MATLQTASAPNTAPSLFSNKTFLSIWIGHTLSMVGDGFHSVALGLWVLTTTGSATAMATVMTVRVIIGILLGAIAGTVVDRVDRRKLMIAMDVARFALVAGMALVVGMPSMPFYGLLVLTGLNSVAGQFFGPAFQASLVNIVGKEQLPRASGLLQITNTLAQVVGPLLGGMVVGFFGGATALMIDASTFLIGAIAITLAGQFASPRRDSAEKRSFVADMKEGFDYMRQNPFIRSLLVMGPAVNFFGNAIGILIPVVAVKVWQVTDVQFGLVEATFPVGFALGAAIIMAVSKKLRRRGLIFTGGVFLTGIAIAAVFQMPNVGLSLPIMLVIGLLMAFVNIVIQIAMQSEVEPAVQGRVFGTMGSLMMVASPISMMVTGLVADQLDPVILGSIMGLCCAAVPLVVSVFSPALRRYN